MSVSHEQINDIQRQSLLDVSEVANVSDEIQITNKREEKEPCSNGFYDLLDELFCHLVSTNAIFKSQQIGDPDLTSNDKRKIGEELLKKSPSIFLLKFGPFLKLKHLDYFTPMNDQIQWSNELEFHIKNLLKMADSKTSKVIKRNRRFGALKKLQQQGNYFSEVEMEKREPLLYHQLVGQYLTEREKLERLCEDDDKEPIISNVLLARAEREEVEALYKAQKEAEDACTEETDSSDENSNSQDTVLTNGDRSSAQGKSIKRWGDDWTDIQNKKPKQSKNNEKNKKNLSSEEKELLFDEFRSIIYSKFLDGEDANFDYSTVDTNPDYDSLEVCSQDAEEKYFDSEEVGQEDGEICTDTGIEDY